MGERAAAAGIGSLRTVESPSTHGRLRASPPLSLSRETIPWEDGGGGRGGAGNPEGRTRPPRERSEGSAARAGRALRTVGLTDRRPGASGGGASGRRPPGIRPLWTVGSPPAPGSPTPQSGSSPVPGGRRAPQRRHREGRQRAGEGRRPKTPGSRSHRRSQSGRRQGISRDERPPPSPERGEERRDEAGGAETPGRSAEGDRPERRARSRDRPREGTAPRLPRAKGDGKANGSEPSERGSALPSAPGPRESERERERDRGGRRRDTWPARPAHRSYLVDPASSHMLVSKIKPCMSKYELGGAKLRMAH